MQPHKKTKTKNVIKLQQIENPQPPSSPISSRRRVMQLDEVNRLSEQINQEGNITYDQSFDTFSAHTKVKRKIRVTYPKSTYSFARRTFKHIQKLPGLLKAPVIMSKIVEKEFQLNQSFINVNPTTAPHLNKFKEYLLEQLESAYQDRLQMVRQQEEKLKMDMERVEQERMKEVAVSVCKVNHRHNRYFEKRRARRARGLFRGRASVRRGSRRSVQEIDRRMKEVIAANTELVDISEISRGIFKFEKRVTRALSDKLLLRKTQIEEGEEVLNDVRKQVWRIENKLKDVFKKVNHVQSLLRLEAYQEENKAQNEDIRQSKNQGQKPLNACLVQP